jgi:hypothetical protein
MTRIGKTFTPIAANTATYTATYTALYPPIERITVYPTTP